MTEANNRNWQAQQDLALCEKASLKEHVARLDEEVKHLNDLVGELTLENTGLSKRTEEPEADLVWESATRRVLEKDIVWILRDRFRWVVDRLIKSYHLLKGLVHVRAVCIVAGVEEGKRASRELVVAREFDPNVV